MSEIVMSENFAVDGRERMREVNKTYGVSFRFSVTLPRIVSG